MNSQRSFRDGSSPIYEDASHAAFDRKIANIINDLLRIVRFYYPRSLIDGQKFINKLWQASPDKDMANASTNSQSHHSRTQTVNKSTL